MVDLLKFSDDLDLDSIASPDDKYDECQYFYELLRNEHNRDHFRWLLSAFLGACYSFIEIKAKSLYCAFSNPETGEPVEDHDSLEILRKYVRAFQDAKNPSFVKTKALDKLLKKLYEIRNENTHHYAMSIIGDSECRPEKFKIGHKKSEAVLALDFCSEILAIFDQINMEIDGL